MDQPQPNATPDVGATPVAQPTEAIQQPAGMPQEPVSQPTNEAPSVDDTADWLSKKGIDPSDPDAVSKLAKSYREAEKLAMSATREASELRKSLATPEQYQDNPQSADPVMNEFLQDYRRDKLIKNLGEAHSDWKEYEPQMANLLYEKVQTPYGVFTRNELVHEGIITLEDVYYRAKASAPVNTDQVKAETRQEVLQTLANTQRAGSATGNATYSNPQAPGEDPILAGIKRARGQ